MQTLRLTEQKKDIEKAKELLLEGELVAFPTETVYGLGALCTSKEAVDKTFTTKGRPADNPLIVHISTIDQLFLVCSLTKETYATYTPFLTRLIDTFWPGPLTIILPRHPDIPDTVSAGLATVAVRFPDHPTALSLIDAVGIALTAPSANTSGKPSPTDAMHVLEDLDGKIAAVIDGGPCRIGIESTVLDITQTPIILRPGAITKEDIENCIQSPIAQTISSEVHQPVSPGMKYKHYAPETPIYLYEDISNVKQEQLENSIILTNNSFPNVVTVPLTMQSLYSTFRDADREHKQAIVIVLDEKTKQHQGLMNRIEKAVGQT